MLFYLIGWLIASFLQGFFFFAVLVFLLYWFYLKELPVNVKPPTRPQFENYEFNPILKEMFSNNDDKNTSTASSTTSSNELRGSCDGVIALNMIFQFLFQELKDTKTVRRYIIRKMSAEFKELLTTKAAGKIVQRITARDFSLGTSFPIIHSLKLDTYKMDPTQKSLHEMSVIVDLEYTNGFSISIDADLILGRSAYIHIKVVSIKGKARLQFSRSPFTHWNFAFIEDPQIEFDANSHFDGRQIPQLTALILNQLRRSVRRKHTLPNYKCRFKPFFDQIYNQNMFKSNIDDILLKNAAVIPDLQKQQSNTLNGNERNEMNAKTGLPRTQSTNSFSSEDIALTNIQHQLSEISSLNKAENDKTNEKIPPSTLLLDEATRSQLYNFKPLHNKEKNSFNSYQYRKLCEKLGFDLTSVGQLIVNLKVCDRLPEALCSFNMPQYQPQNQQQTNLSQSTLPSSSSSYSLNSPTNQDSCFIYLTASLDQISMKSLMSKQICKEHWPLIEFELTKPNSLSLGLLLTEFFLINRNEVVISKIVPDTPAASLTDIIKMFDIIYSFNQIRVTSIKQLNKLIQKTPPNTILKFVVQRPCILMENKVNSSSNVSNNKKLLNQVSEQSKMSVSSPVPVNLPASSNTPVNNTSVSNTRQRLEYLEKKIKFSFASINNASLTTPAIASSVNSTPTPVDQLLPIIPSTPTESSSTSFPTAVATPAANQNQPQSLITASSHCLVDFFCSLCECSTNEKVIDLDLISLLTDRTPSLEEAQKRNEFYLKKTRDIKLEKENLFAFNSLPIPVEETYAFDLNEDSKYLNIFLWTSQYTNKMSKVKPLLIGYVTLPLHEINVDCWNTSKGETQTTVHFNPLDEFKASAASAKLSRSHVISDHPGFDSSLSVGSLTINFQHVLKISHQVSTTSANQLNQNFDERKITDTIVEELVDQNIIQTNISKSDNINNELSNDDGSIHKFVSIQFNESVACEFCNKKIWFKNAFQCIYCNYKIHMKCYEKAFGKTICPRFFSKNKSSNEPNLKINNVENDLNLNEDTFEMVNSSACDKNSLFGDGDQISINSSSSNVNSTRSIVSNFLSGIRQRRTNTNQSESQNSGNSFNLLNSFSLTKNRPVTPNLFEMNKNNNNNINDDLSNVDLDEFKDIDQNEEKLFGTELFDELPLEERKAKFDELISKYQSTIDMMQRLKSEYEKELDAILKSKKNRVAKSFLNTSVFNHKEERIRSEIKHTEEQMKCVMFLLMQCQIGLSNCIDIQSANETKSTGSPGSKSSLETEELENKIPVITIKKDEDFLQ